MFKRIIWIISGLFLIMLLSVACSPAATPSTPTQALQPTVQTGNQPTQAGTQPTQALPVTGSQTVTVTETEFKLDMPTSVQAGSVTFNVTNKGAVPHSLEIQGQGIDQKLPAVLQPGQSGTLQVTLKAGTYTVFCPVDSHKDQGMTTNLSVQ